MLEEKSKKYELELKQIKSLMNEALKLLPEGEQKQVDKDIYYDSRADRDLQHIDTFLHTQMFYMYYNNEYFDGGGFRQDAVILDIYPDKTMSAYAIHKGHLFGDLKITSTFEGNLQSLYDVLPSCSLEKIISQ